MQSNISPLLYAIHGTVIAMIGTWAGVYGYHDLLLECDMEYGFSLTSRVYGLIGISLICDGRFDALDTAYEVAHILDQTTYDGGRGGVSPVFIKETFRSLRLRDRSCGRKC
jgi:hypothetical protein